MTAIGRPLRGAQLIAPLSQPRVVDARRAAAVRQRAAIQRTFVPVANDPRIVQVGGATRPASIRVPRETIPSGARRVAQPRGAIGVSAWSAGRDGIAGSLRGRAFGVGLIVFVAMFAFVLLATETSTSGALVRGLRDDQTRLMEEIRSGESDMDPLGREPEIRRRAFELGVGQLGSPLLVEER